MDFDVGASEKNKKLVKLCVLPALNIVAIYVQHASERALRQMTFISTSTLLPAHGFG